MALIRRHRICQWELQNVDHVTFEKAEATFRFGEACNKVNVLILGRCRLEA